MKRKVSNRIMYALVLLMLTACGTAKERKATNETAINRHNEKLTVEKNYLNLTESQRELAKRNNSFALELVRTLSGMKSHVVSPLSITYLMSMLANGAEGETKEEIMAALGWKDVSLEEINAFCGSLIAQAGCIDPATRLYITNYLGVNKGHRLLDDYTGRMKSDYRAEIEQLDFGKRESVDHINKWCALHTEGMIPRLIEELDPQAVAILMNAIYFNSTWQEKFSPQETREEQFFGYTRDIVKVPMMHRQDTYSYLETADYTAVRLPYGNGNFAMTILLPAEGSSLQELTDSFTSARIDSLNRQMEECMVDIKLPRFTIESEWPLNKVIAKLGAPRMFAGGEADFSSMSKKELYVSQMLQKAKIEVTEEGTKAAAVTGAIMMATSLRPEPRRVTFHANRPFMYFISERSSGALFFVGQYTGK